MDEAGVTVLQDIIDKLLKDAEYDQFFLRQHALPIIMETAARIHTTRATDLLEQVIDCRLQTKVLEGRRHKAMRDITDKLDGIVNNLLGVVNALQLRGLVLINEVLI